MSRYQLDAAQRQYLITRITTIEQDLIQLSSLSIHKQRRDAALVGLSRLSKEVLAAELAGVLGYYENPGVVSPRPESARVVNEVNQGLPVLGMSSRKTASIRKEGCRLRDAVSLNTLDENPATLLLNFSEFKAV